MGLGAILGGIGAVAAAPFTGGTSLAWLPAAISGGGAVADAITHSGGGNTTDQRPTDPRPTTQPPPSGDGMGAGGKTAEALALLGGLLAGHQFANRGAQNAVPRSSRSTWTCRISGWPTRTRCFKP
jgi:hypothetical protein